MMVGMKNAMRTDAMKVDVVWASEYEAYLVAVNLKDFQYAKTTQEIDGVAGVVKEAVEKWKELK